MDEFPTDFLFLLLGIIVGVIVLALIIHWWQEHKRRRLQDPRKDHTYDQERG